MSPFYSRVSVALTHIPRAETLRAGVGCVPPSSIHPSRMSRPSQVIIRRRRMKKTELKGQSALE